MVIKIIEETAYGLQEKYAIEMEALGMHYNHITSSLQCPSQDITRRNSAHIQKYYCKSDIPKVSGNQERVI